VSDHIADTKYQQNKRNVLNAYKLYKANLNENESQFWLAVLEFAKIKLYFLELEFSNVGSSSTVDDYSQEVALSVWSNLPSFNGESDNSFYAWLHKICYNKANVFFNDLMHTRDSKEPVTRTVHGSIDSVHYEEEVDNPVLHESQERDFFITIPNSVQGVDRDICKLLLIDPQIDGNGDEEKPRRKRETVYARIAGTLGLTENAVELRLRRLRTRLRKEREEERNKYRAERGAASRPTTGGVR
jgi:DNA-directed RNA polymerase specialized sigma24 family protein